MFKRGWIAAMLMALVMITGVEVRADPEVGVVKATDVAGGDSRDTDNAKAAGASPRNGCVDVCKGENRQGVAHCDAAFAVHGDTVQHRECLASVRWNFDSCMQACGR